MKILKNVWAGHVNEIGEHCFTLNGIDYKVGDLFELRESYDEGVLISEKLFILLKDKEKFFLMGWRMDTEDEFKLLSKFKRVIRSENLTNAIFKSEGFEERYGLTLEEKDLNLGISYKLLNKYEKNGIITEKVEINLFLDLIENIKNKTNVALIKNSNNKVLGRGIAKCSTQDKYKSSTGKKVSIAKAMLDLKF